ncbi:MAG: 5'-nucleotidase C-terminal domain-containing protein [Myxococcota bacterium]
MRALVLFAAAFLWGCIAYNDNCTPPVEQPNERIGFLAEEVFIDRANTRHANNAVGQLAADAFVDAFAQSSAPAQLGVVNGGAIRAEGLCTTRNILERGPVTRGLLHEVLLFENLVTAVDLEEQEVWDLFEHSVARLVASPAEVISPAGGFLQVSKEVRMEVSCTAAAGARVAALQIGSETLQRPGRAGKRFRVALSSFLLGGGDGYAMLVAPGKDPERNPAQSQTFGGVDNATTADFMKRTYNESEEAGLRLDTARQTLNGCSQPPRPP